MEKLLLNIAADKNCIVKSYSNLTAVFTWIGLELGWKIYLHSCSQSVLCMLRVRVMFRQNLLRVVELSGDFVTTTHETCMTHCPDRLHYPVPTLTLMLLSL
jgi:hypothetical protein